MTAERTPDARVEAAAYTPTTEQVRNKMAFGAACGAVARQVPDAALADAMRDIDWPTPGVRPKAKAQFDAWLAAHDAEVLAALTDGLTERVDSLRRPNPADPRWLRDEVRGWNAALEAVVAAIYGERP